MTGTAITTVDLFSGCGGFSLGAELAGCRTLAAVDIDADLQSAYGLNFPRTKVVLTDIADLDAPAWSRLLGKQRPDGVVGGPPCQGFSRMGKRAKDDPRNSLVGHFYRQVEVLKPKFFVMENVEGILDQGNCEILDRAMEKVRKLYTVLSPVVIDASDFGAATSRRRVVVVGFDPDAIDSLTDDDIRGTLSKATVRDAIADLPSPISMDASDDFGWSRYPKIDKRKLPAYAKQLRAAPPPGLGFPAALAMLRAGKVSGVFETVHTQEVTKRFAQVMQGKCDVVSKCPRLDWDGLCPTLRAGTGRDKGSFQSIRPIHPSEPRVITVREAARLQGFPDWFVFHPTKWHSFRMIGNSVSPMVSKALIFRIIAGKSLAVAA